MLRFQYQKSGRLSAISARGLWIANADWDNMITVQETTKSESGRGGWKTQGGGKHTVNSAKNPSPKTFLDPPPTIRFPPPPFWRLSVISLKRKRHRPDQPQFLRPPKVVLESTLCGTFHSRQIHAIRFAPPQPLPNKRPGNPEVSRYRSRVIRPSLIAARHSKTSVLGAFVPLKRGVTKL